MSLSLIHIYKFGGKSWILWDEDVRLREPAALKRYQDELREDIIFYQYLQFEFFEQWKNVKNYAHEKGIQIVGDIPIYVAFDSADTWANPELFQLDENNLPVAVAGCPPDGFSATGQLWGNPLYRWDYHKSCLLYTSFPKRSCRTLRLRGNPTWGSLP